MNITCLAEQAGDKPFFLNQPGIDSIYLIAPLIVAAIITTLVLAFMIEKGDDLFYTIFFSSIVAIIITAFCLFIGFMLGALVSGNKPQQSSEEFEAWAHARYNISIDVTSDNMRDFLNSETTEVIDDDGNIVSVRNVNDKIIITNPDEAYQELPHGK